MKNTLRALMILKYLWQTTDENHSVSTTGILEYLAAHNIAANRKTISGDCQLLMDCGYDVICNKSRQNQYFIGSRTFELPELKLLVDAVLAAQFIPADKSGILISKIASLAGPYDAKALNRELYIDSRVKTTNREIYYSVDLLHTAINEGKKVTFNYRTYTPDKEKILRHGGQLYVLSPFDLVWSDDRYYVFGWSDSHGKVVSFRVDRMVKPQITKERAVPKPEDYDISVFFREVFMMYDGERMTVTLNCENSLMKDIVDRFGEEVDTQPVDDSRFTAKVDVACSPIFFSWVFTYGGGIQITAPEKAVEAYRVQLKKALDS